MSKSKGGGMESVVSSVAKNEGRMKKPLGIMELVKYVQKMENPEIVPQDLTSYESLSYGNAFKFVGKGSIALLYYSRAIDRVEEKDKERWTKILKLRGECYVSLKRYEEAVEDFSRIITVHPANYNYFVQRGSCYVFDEGNWENAKCDFESARKIDPSRYESYFQIGNMHLRKKEIDYGQAVSNLTKALENIQSKRSTDFTSILFLRGFCFIATNNFERCLDDFNTCLELKATFRHVMMFRGIVLILKTKEFDAGRNDLKKWCQLDPCINLPFNIGSSLFSKTLLEFIISIEEMKKSISYLSSFISKISEITDSKTRDVALYKHQGKVEFFKNEFGDKIREHLNSLASTLLSSLNTNFRSYFTAESIISRITIDFNKPKLTEIMDAQKTVYVRFLKFADQLKLMSGGLNITQFIDADSPYLKSQDFLNSDQNIVKASPFIIPNANEKKSGRKSNNVGMKSWSSIASRVIPDKSRVIPPSHIQMERMKREEESRKKRQVESFICIPRLLHWEIGYLESLLQHSGMTKDPKSEILTKRVYREDEGYFVVLGKKWFNTIRSEYTFQIRMSLINDVYRTDRQIRVDHVCTSVDINELGEYFGEIGPFKIIKEGMKEICRDCAGKDLGCKYFILEFSTIREVLNALVYSGATIRGIPVLIRPCFLREL